MLIKRMLFCTSLFSLSVTALPEDTVYDWFYTSGKKVPEIAKQKIAATCHIDEAIADLANVKDNEFNTAFNSFQLAVNCITNKGIAFKPVGAANINK